MNMDTAGWVAIIGAAFLGFTTLATQVLTLWLAYQREDAKLKRDLIVAGKVEQVRVETKQATAKTEAKLDEIAGTAEASGVKLDTIAETGEATHTLVNSNMGVQLRLNAELSRWKAEQTGKAEDLRAAELAEELLRDHEAKQDRVDASQTEKGTP